MFLEQFGDRFEILCGTLAWVNKAILDRTPPCLIEIIRLRLSHTIAKGYRIDTDRFIIFLLNDLHVHDGTILLKASLGISISVTFNKLCREYAFQFVHSLVLSAVSAVALRRTIASNDGQVNT